MGEQITAKFETLSQAEAAATKLQSIRAEEVEISEWDAPSRDSDVDIYAHSEMLPSYAPDGSRYYPTASSPTTSSGLAMMPYAAIDGYAPSPGAYSASYLLNARVADEQKEMALRIVRECGGGEL